MTMFACIYCPEDKSLTVLGERSKKLQLLGEFKEKESVKLTWGKTVYNGTIVKIGEDEQYLDRFAIEANNKILKRSHTKHQDEILEMLYGFSFPASTCSEKGKRKKESTVPRSPTTVAASTTTTPLTPAVSSNILGQFTAGADSSDCGQNKLNNTDLTNSTNKTKQKLFENEKTTNTPLTTTWALCTGNRQPPPNPPVEVLDIFRALRKPEVVQYITSFLQHYEEDRNTEDEDMMYVDMEVSQVTTHHSPTFYTTRVTRHSYKLLPTILTTSYSMHQVIHNII